MDFLSHTVALIGVVIIVAALLSGVIDRTGLPQVVLFLLLGAALGPAGLDIISFTLESGALRSIAVLGLVLVLFSDALGVDVKGLGEHRKLVALVLGPGTVVTAAVVTLAGWAILGLSVPAAAILGAALASTDPVMIRGLLRHADVPVAARQALRFESGVNDVVLLPIVLVAMAFMGREGGLRSAEWSRLGLELLLLGPGAGVAVGLVGIAMLDFIRRRFGVRRDYESLYALGLAFTAFAAAEAVHGSGFLAAFAAGLTVAVVDVELCDCFLDYGQATAEMFLLFSFVAFGTGPIWRGADVAGGPTLLFAAIALGVRALVLWISLSGLTLDSQSRKLIIWFGPRGLSSLLLVLLPVFAGIGEAEALFPICSLVVLLSVAGHGTILPLLLRRKLAAAAATTASRATGAAAPHPGPLDTRGSRPPVQQASAGREKITLPELHDLWERGEPVRILDVRTERSWREDTLQARGAIRVDPDRARDVAAELALPREDWLVAYCT